jgi:hypothetical protein
MFIYLLTIKSRVMVKVQAHGDTTEITNPVTREVTRMINVVFVEEGRDGADKNMSESSRLLSELIGEEVGLKQIRTHTHPVLEEQIGNFPIGAEFPFHISRGLYSEPQIRQQVDKPARIVDGKPTFFKTWLSKTIDPDQDYRKDVNILASNEGTARVFGVNVGATTVRTVKKSEESRNTNAEDTTYAQANVLAGAQNPVQQGAQG